LAPNFFNTGQNRSEFHMSIDEAVLKYSAEVEFDFLGVFFSSHFRAGFYRGGFSSDP